MCLTGGETGFEVGDFGLEGDQVCVAGSEGNIALVLNDTFSTSGDAVALVILSGLLDFVLIGLIGSSSIFSGLCTRGGFFGLSGLFLGPITGFGFRSIACSLLNSSRRYLLISTNDFRTPSSSDGSIMLSSRSLNSTNVIGGTFFIGGVTPGLKLTS